jgi:hypothetical protein
MFAGRWEGVPGWSVCVDAMDRLMAMISPCELLRVRSRSGGTVYPAVDVISAAEAVSFHGLSNEAPQIRPVWVGPAQLGALPDWDQSGPGQDLETVARYAYGLRLPFEHLFLDFCDHQGRPHWFEMPHGPPFRCSLYGAIMAQCRRDSEQLFASGSLVVIPFGAAGEAPDWEGPRRPVHSRMDGVVLTPAPAPLGFVQFGGLPVGHDAQPEVQSIVLGETHILGSRQAPRPMLALLHVLPMLSLGHEYGVNCVVGSGDTVGRALEGRDNTDVTLGVHYLEEGEDYLRDFTMAEASIVTAQACQALKALYLLDSHNVDLEPVPVSRQVRRSVERSQGKREIALTVAIRRTRRDYQRRPPSGRTREYSHAHDRRGYYRHVTRGSHVQNPDKLTPCVEHPVCRREYVRPTVVGAAPGRIYIPKTREIREQGGME